MQIPGLASDLPLQHAYGWGSIIPQMILGRIRLKNGWLGLMRNVGCPNKEEGTTWASGS